MRPVEYLPLVKVAVRPDLYAPRAQSAQRYPACMRDRTLNRGHGPSPSCHVSGDAVHRVRTVKPMLSWHYSEDCQVASGLYVSMRGANSAVRSPRFFWYTLPCWLTMRVITPELPHSTG